MILSSTKEPHISFELKKSSSFVNLTNFESYTSLQPSNVIWLTFWSPLEYPFFQEMSSFATINFPHRGDVAATRAWLDQQGFNDKFVEWVADSLLGINYEIMSMKFSLPEEIDRLHRLWGLLETARKERGK